MDKDGTYSEKETASRADAALRRALNTPPQPKHGKVKESKGERGEQGLSGKTHGAPLKPGDMVGGFLVVSTDPALLAAMEYVSQAHLRSHRTDTEEVRLRAQRQLISDYVGQAVTSPAGVLAFPGVGGNASTKRCVPSYIKRPIAAPVSPR